MKGGWQYQQIRACQTGDTVRESAGRSGCSGPGQTAHQPPVGSRFNQLTFIVTLAVLLETEQVDFVVTCDTRGLSVPAARTLLHLRQDTGGCREPFDQPEAMLALRFRPESPESAPARQPRWSEGRP